MTLAQLMPAFAPVWNRHGNSDIQNELCRREEKDKEQREKALVGNQIIKVYLPPRRVWDLYSNRVVPFWIADELLKSWGFTGVLQPISHAWVDEKNRMDVWTPINGKGVASANPKGCQSQTHPD